MREVPIEKAIKILRAKTYARKANCEHLGIDYESSTHFIGTMHISPTERLLHYNCPDCGTTKTVLSRGPYDRLDSLPA